MTLIVDDRKARRAKSCRAYRQRNREAVNRRKRDWEKRNSVHVAAYNKKYQREYYLRNREDALVYERDKRDREKARHLLHGAKIRAKKLGLPFDLSLADVQIPDLCPVLGIPLRRNAGYIGPADNSPTLDRIVPERGYVSGNVAVISFRANSIKRNATAEELMKVALWVASKVSKEAL
jgi:hypothetical protein